MISKKTAFLCAMAFVSLFIPESVLAYDGEMFSDQITTIEKLITGGYMRIGLLIVCIGTAAYGAFKQNVGMFLSGVAACLIVFMMKGWITTTFAYVI